MGWLKTDEKKFPSTQKKLTFWTFTILGHYELIRCFDKLLSSCDENKIHIRLPVKFTSAWTPLAESDQPIRGLDSLFSLHLLIVNPFILGFSSKMKIVNGIFELDNIKWSTWTLFEGL